MYEQNLMTIHVVENNAYEIRRSKLQLMVYEKWYKLKYLGVYGFIHSFFQLFSCIYLDQWHVELKYCYWLHEYKQFSLYLSLKNCDFTYKKVVNYFNCADCAWNFYCFIVYIYIDFLLLILLLSYCNVDKL